MRLQDLTSGQWATQAGFWIGQHAPRWIGHGIAWLAARVIALRKPAIYWTVRANLRQVLGLQADERTLHRMASQVFLHTGRAYYDFFHAIGQPQEVLARAVRVPEQLVALLRSGTTTGRGVLFLGIHLSNFDLGILALGARGLSIQVLSLADPTPGFRFQNRLRATAGFEITPITPESLRAAVRRLKGGGTVSTGLDRPVPVSSKEATKVATTNVGHACSATNVGHACSVTEATKVATTNVGHACSATNVGHACSVTEATKVATTKEKDAEDRAQVEFFGRPAYLPLGPVRIALMAQATVVVGCCHYCRQEGYVMEFTGPIEMVRSGDRQQDILANARRLASILEGYVRAHPEQWLMFHPFWPTNPFS